MRPRSARIHRVIAPIAMVLLALGAWASAWGDELATPADPASLGFSPAGLARIAPWFQARFDAFQEPEGLVPGAVVAIAKDGKLAYLQAMGFQDRAKTVPMKTDAIFWIASMSKPVTSVAAMMLVEEGRLELDAPIARYLPELEGMRVQETDAVTGRTPFFPDAPRRAITVRDLLRHTSGFIYPELTFAFPEDGLPNPDAKPAIVGIHALYDRRTRYRRDRPLADFVSSLAALPLAHQPGEVFEYGWSAEVLSRVVEVASGERFDRFLQGRIFDPLRMVDTGFQVPADKLDRLVDSPMARRPPIWDVTKPAVLYSGDAGLVSTAADYLRFCQMLLDGGELEGVRVLKPETVQAMTANALPPGVRIYGGEEVGARAGATFGLGFAIRTDPARSWIPGSVGSFGWGGHWGTFFWIDPARHLAGVQMIQAAPGPGRAAVPLRGINQLVYGALADGPRR
jgi:CubicO group peptidase (beta-lactamase class C family)